MSDESKTLNDVGRPPWDDDVEAWLEASNAEEIADDIERYTMSEVRRAVAREREWCAKLEVALETLVSRCNQDFPMAADEAVISAEATLERLYKWRTSNT